MTEADRQAAAAAAEPGFFLQRLQETGLLLPSGGLNPDVASPEDSNSKHRYIFNHVILEIKRPATILYIFRDLGHLFSPVNLATGLHQFAKLQGALVRFASRCLSNITENACQYLNMPTVNCNNMSTVSTSEDPSSVNMKTVMLDSPQMCVLVNGGESHARGVSMKQSCQSNLCQYRCDFLELAISSATSVLST